MSNRVKNSSGAVPAAQSPAADLAEHGHWTRLKALVEPRAATKLDPKFEPAQKDLKRLKT